MVSHGTAPRQVKHRITIRFLGRTENGCSSKLCMNGHSSPITRAKRVETAQESIRDGQINKCGFPHTGGYYGAIDVDAALIQATAGMDFTKLYAKWQNAGVRRAQSWWLPWCSMSRELNSEREWGQIGGCQELRVGGGGGVRIGSNWWLGSFYFGGSWLKHFEAK